MYSTRVGISPFCSYQQFSYDVVFCVLWHLMFVMAIGEVKMPCRLSSD